MDNPTALEKARVLCGYHFSGDARGPCPRCNAIAAELKRAFAAGIDKAFTSGYSSMTWRLAGEARKEADQLEGK